MKQFDDFFKSGKKLDIVELKVPEDVKFISDWKDFRYPFGHVIFDKTICGCGFTEYCLNNGYPTILCSPRKILLENKMDQHKNDKNIYYFKNEKDESEFNYDSDMEGLSKEQMQKLDDRAENTIDNDTKQEYINVIKERLSEWLNNNVCDNPKILVTYDSLKHVISVLKKTGDLPRFNIVIDEFQSIFCDASFKSDVELNFVQLIKFNRCQNVLYLSATPMLERYLGIMDYFKDLPVYKLIWSDSKVETINVSREYAKSITVSCSKFIQEYKSGIFPQKILPDKSIHVSKELVFFVNSVKIICDLIKKNKLKPEECNIICSQTSYNKNKIKKLGSGFDYGKIPTKGQPHKMFTFCTRTAYLGADFYSESAYTIICSNINIKTLIVDISLDLPQIVGRQRLESNVFRNDIKILYTGKSKKAADVTLEEFIENEEKKEEYTRMQLKGYNEMNYESKKAFSIKLAKFARAFLSDDYVGVDSSTGLATYNYIAKISSLRSFEISRPDYQERVLIKRDLDSANNITINEEDISGLGEFLESFKQEFNLDNNFTRRMKMYVELVFKFPEIYTLNIKIFQSIIPPEYQGYMNLLGPERIKANKYIEADMKREADYLLKANEIRGYMIMTFKEGNRYTSKYIKEKLGEIYSNLNIEKTPKASELVNYFDIKECLISNGTKRDRGFEIIKVKEEVQCQ